VTIQKEKWNKAYIEFKKKFMVEYIRSGRRTNGNKPSPQALDKASKKIIKRIKEGAFPEYKIRESPAPEILEQLKSLGSMNAGVPKINVQGIIEEQEDNKDFPVLQLNENVLPFNFGAFTGLGKKDTAGSDNSSIQIQVDPKNQKRFSVIFTPLNAPKLTSPSKDPSKTFHKKKTSVLEREKNTPLENDIDTVANMLHYFPHNNFSSIFPKYAFVPRMSLFDFNAQSNTSKSTLKKFVNILRNRVNDRKDQLEAAFVAAAGRREPPKKTTFFAKEANQKTLSIGRERSKSKRKSVLVAIAQGDEADDSDGNGSDQ